MFCTKCTARELSEGGLSDINEKVVVMKRLMELTEEMTLANKLPIKELSEIFHNTGQHAES